MTEKQQLELSLSQEREAQRATKEETESLSRKLLATERRAALADTDISLQHEQTKRQMEMCVSFYFKRGK